MKDKYKKTEWIDGKAKLTSDKLNNIEEGIANLFENALTVSEIYGGDGIQVDVVKCKDILIHTKKGYYMNAAQIKNAIAEAQLPEKDVDLSGKADADHVHRIDEVVDYVDDLNSTHSLRELLDTLEDTKITEEDLEKFIEEKGLTTKEYVEQYVKAQVNSGLGNIDLSSVWSALGTKANSEDVYTKAQADRKFLTTHQDISGKADKTELFSKDYNDLINKPTDHATETFVRNEVGKVLEAGYVTSTELERKGYLTEHQDISGKANVGDSYTKEESDNKYLTEHQDISGKANVEHTHQINEITDLDVNSIGRVKDVLVNNESVLDNSGIANVNLEGYATEGYVATKIAEAQLNGDDGDIDLSVFLRKDSVPNVVLTGSFNDLAERPDLSDYLKKTDTSEYVKTVSINGGEKFNVDTSGNVDVINSVSYNDLTDKPEIISPVEVDSKISTALEGLATEEFVNTAISNVNLTGYLTSEVAEETYAKKGDVFSKNYNDLTNTPDLSSFVKSITVNGEAAEVNPEGEIELTIPTVGEDTRLSQDMIDYLNSKLTYTYGYSCSVTGVSSIDLPSSTSSITFTATPGVTKKNDSGSKPISITSVSTTTSGWTKTGNNFTKTVTLDKTLTSVSSGSITVSITNSDNKTGTASGSKSASFTKPWYIFGGSAGTLTNPGSVVEGFISGTSTSLKTNRTAINTKVSIGITQPYLWFAIPNTRTMGSVEQIAGLSAISEKYSSVTTSLGNYKIFGWNGALATGGTLEFNLKIN